MSRRHSAERRPIKPDIRYESPLVTKLINAIMSHGEKATAQRIVYNALDLAARRLGVAADNLLGHREIVDTAVQHVRPSVEVRSRRVGGSTYQVPTEVRAERSQALALRWIVLIAGNKKGVPMHESLAAELINARNNQGAAVKKREDTHRMAEANKAFAHFRW